MEKMLTDVLNTFSTLDNNGFIPNSDSEPSQSWPVPSAQDHNDKGQPSCPQFTSVQGIRIPSESIVSVVDMDMIDAAGSTSDQGDTLSRRHESDKNHGALSQRAQTFSYLIRKVGAIAERFKLLKLVPRGYDVRTVMCTAAILTIISMLLYHVYVTFIHTSTLQVDQVIV